MACQYFDGEFERLLKGILELSSRSDLFRDQDSILFELFDLTLDGYHHIGAGGFDRALHKRFDLPLDVCRLLAKLLIPAA